MLLLNIPNGMQIKTLTVNGEDKKGVGSVVLENKLEVLMDDNKTVVFELEEIPVPTYSITFKGINKERLSIEDTSLDITKIKENTDVVIVIDLQGDAVEYLLVNEVEIDITTLTDGNKLLQKVTENLVVEVSFIIPTTPDTSFTFTWQDIDAKHPEAGYRVTAFTGSETRVSIPEVHDGSAVKYIDEDAFKNKDTITELEIPITILEMPRGGLSGCSALTKLTIPFVGLTRNAKHKDANSWFALIFGDTIYNGSYEVFDYVDTCYIPNNLSEVVITNTKQIPMQAFYNIKTLEKITLKYGVESILGFAFYGCAALKNITLPETVLVLATDAFRECNNLEAINVAESNATYSSHEGVLYSDFGKTLLLYPVAKKDQTYKVLDGVTKIEDSAIGNGHILKLVLPDTLKEIGNSAFKTCVNLHSINLPDGL